MTRSKKGISIGLVVLALLIAWFLFGSDEAKAATAAAGGAEAAPPVDGGRVTKELEIEADIYSPNFGMSSEDVAAAKRNPAVDPTMRDLIDRSNQLITSDPSDWEAP